jgi:very-short-patch-repair endonuclease
MGLDKCESYIEEKMYDLFTNYEIYSMVKNVRQQVWFFGKRYRVDFLLDVPPNNTLIIEVDGWQHRKRRGYDWYRTKHIEKLGHVVMRVDGDELLKTPEKVANKIEGAIARLQG